MITGDQQQYVTMQNKLETCGTKTTKNFTEAKKMNVEVESTEWEETADESMSEVKQKRDLSLVKPNMNIIKQ